MLCEVSPSVASAALSEVESSWGGAAWGVVDVPCVGCGGPTPAVPALLEGGSGVRVILN